MDTLDNPLDDPEFVARMEEAEKHGGEVVARHGTENIYRKTWEELHQVLNDRKISGADVLLEYIEKPDECRV